MKILVACEYSGRVREAFKAKGHDVTSCDFLDTEIEGKHYKGDVMDILYDGWDMLIAHPPCTYLCNSGVSWLYKNPNTIHLKINDKSVNYERWKNMLRASMFFKKLQKAPIDKICIENPIPHKYGQLGKYTQKIQPWQFGHGETKATCLWLKNLPELVPTNIVEGREQRLHNLGPSKDRWKKRSLTYQGIADAMAEQWG